MRKIIPFIIGILILGLFATGILLAVPSLRERVVFHADQLRTRIRYAIKPPEEAVFVPDEAVAAIVQATMAALAPTATPTPQVTPSPTPLFTPTITPTPTPLPPSVTLTGVRYEDQHGLWNYCAPATLSMALSYWGWEGKRTDIGPVVKPFEKDKNVMPYELAEYVQENTNLSVALRSGGTLDLLKTLLANQFTVLIEKGIVIRDYNGRLGWMGHYTVVTGYDDAKREFTTQDSYFTADYIVNYDDLLWQWRGFNYIFLVVYSPDREDQLMQVLGNYADPQESYRIAARIASEEAVALDGVEQFFAYFNRGTSLVNLQDYNGAAGSFDQAFNLMAALPEQERPWRIMWYQTGPYFAYYFMGRYQDVIDLATTTLDAVSEPFIEESFIWRARARLALGDTQGAAEDTVKSLEYHPGFIPALELAQTLGIQP